MGQMQVRKAQDRGGADHGWLKTQHTFSFADYHDPNLMGFSVLRVINEDHIEGGSGFPMHAHRDMEIITVVLEGALEHRDTLGTHSVIRPGEVQRMSAGQGVRHSEFNSLRDGWTHLYQIWLLPDRAGHEASYEQKNFAESLEKNPWVLAVSPNGREGSLRMNQNAELWLAKLQAGEKSHREIKPGRKVWIQIIEGHLEMEGQKLSTGDGVALVDFTSIDLSSSSGARLLWFDLP